MFFPETDRDLKQIEVHLEASAALRAEIRAEIAEIDTA